VSGAFSNTKATYNLISGRVDNSGAGTVTIPGGTASVKLDLTASHSTTLQINPTTATNPSSLAVFSRNVLDLPTGYPYAGNYSGTIQDKVTNKSQALAVIIQADESLAGSEVVNSSGSLSVVTVSGTVSTTGAIAFSTQSNQTYGTGNLTKGVALYGNVQLNNGDTAYLLLNPVQIQGMPPVKSLVR
jgi:hypothetical protein